MHGFPNQTKFLGFKPMNEEGEIVYPPVRDAERRFKLDRKTVSFDSEDEGNFLFLDAPKDTVLYLATFYTEEAALKVYDFLAKGNLLDARV